VGLTYLNLNWLAIVVGVALPTRYWVRPSRTRHVHATAAMTLAGEVKLVNRSVGGSSVAIILRAVFTLLVLNNFFGLAPYVFTARRHIRFALPLRLLLWLSLFVAASTQTFTLFMAHLVPKGTPVLLIPFIVLIELVRGVIRPFTLAVRLAANIVAGHLILVLVAGPASHVSWGIVRMLLGAVLLLSLLEAGVALIQSYVFVRLSSLYVSEVNTDALT